MRNQYLRWTCLLAIALILPGCGGEATPPDQRDPAGQAEQTDDQPLAMVVETSEPTYWVGDAEVSTIDSVRTMIGDLKLDEQAGLTIRIDESFDRIGQLRVLLEPVADSQSSIDLKAQSDLVFEELKQAFDQQAKDAAMQEESYHRGQVQAAADQVKQLQKTLHDLQEITRGSPTTSESRLERRKLSRQIEVALANQIAAEKAVNKAELRNDRKRFIVLLRVR